MYSLTLALILSMAFIVTTSPATPLSSPIKRDTCASDADCAECQVCTNAACASDWGCLLTSVAYKNAGEQLEDIKTCSVTADCGQACVSCEAGFCAMDTCPGGEEPRLCAVEEECGSCASCVSGWCMVREIC